MNPDMGLWDMVVKLLVATALGGLVGFEREAHERPAGLRTHILVCLGSTLFTLASFTIADDNPRNDPARLAAQIVTGIGFLGAGTILHRGSVVRGLTTAASIWSVAAIGIAIAIGGKMLYVAIVASWLVVGTLTLVRRLEGYLLTRPHEMTLSITIAGDHATLSRILSVIALHDVTVRATRIDDEPDETHQIVRIKLTTGHHFDHTSLNNDLAASQDVISYSWD